MKSKKKGVVYTILMIIIVGILLFAFYKMANRNFTDSTDATKTNLVTDIITMDIEKKYPPTPREVVDLYSQILTCFYNKKCSNEEIDTLGKQARVLMDTKLLENNPEGQYLQDLKAEVEEYKKNKCTIVNYTISENDEVKYVTKEKEEFALVTAQYFMKSNEEYQRTTEDYVLRKDSNGLWKIYGYTVSKENSSSEEE